MKKTSKTLLLVLCAVLLIVGSVAGTFAYLTDSKEVVNTFTVGKVKITLDEANVDGDTVGEGENETTPERDGANDYHLIPGSTYTKDPTVTVEAESENAYVRMKVTVENIDKLEEALPAADHPAYYADNVFLLQSLCVDKNGKLTWDGETWMYEGYTTSEIQKTVGEEPVTVKCGTYEFRYVGNTEAKDGIVAKADDATKLPALFTDITVPGKDVTNDNIGKFAEVVIKVTAEAIQSEGFAAEGDLSAADVAWAAFDAE